jgi:hypothetical protein
MSTRSLSIGYATVILLGMALMFSRPNYNWDMLPYSALAFSYDNVSPDSLHALAYHEAERVLPAAKYALLVDSTNAYRRQALRDPQFFGRELSFYSIKPLYVAAIWGFHHLGFSMPQATVLPSVISFALIAALLLAWTRRLVPEPYAVALSLSVALAPFVLQNARESAPDLAAAVLLLTGSYHLIEGRARAAGMALLALAVLVRVDALLFVLMMALYLDHFRIVPRRHVAIMVSCAGLATGLILLRQREVVGQLFIVRTAVARASDAGSGSLVASYLQGLKGSLIQLSFSGIWMAISLALVTLYARTYLAPRLRQDRPSMLLILVLGHIGTRFLLHPIIEHRFFIADYLLIWIAFLITLHDLIGAGGARVRAAPLIQ